jgi:hypothetical protein
MPHWENRDTVVLLGRPASENGHSIFSGRNTAGSTHTATLSDAARTNADSSFKAFSHASNLV